MHVFNVVLGICTYVQYKNIHMFAAWGVCE